MNSKIEFVLDASALLALLQGEPGAEVVGSMLEESAIGAVNYSEVLSRLIRRGVDPERAAEVIGSLRVPVLPFDQELARQGSDLARYGWTHGLSLADRACLALARQYNVPAVTADAAWEIPGLPVEVRLIR